MKIKCMKCKKEVVEGVIEQNEKGRKIFSLMNQKPEGIIIKNGSNNPKDWTGLCSECQKEKDKNET